MGLFKAKNGIWKYDFWRNKQRFQGSTKIKNRQAAELWLSKFKVNLALTGVGLVQKDPPPVLSSFLETSFLDAVRQQHAHKPNTLKFYTQRIKVLCSYQPFKTLTLDNIGELAVQGYKDWRLTRHVTPTRTVSPSALTSPPFPMIEKHVPAYAHLSIATINAELRVLRKALRFADKCKLARYCGVSTLPGEKSRDFVLSGEMEIAYLSLAPYPLKQCAILMLDLGLRPGECVALRKDDVRYTDVTIRTGKTINARRNLPQTERTREVLELCFALHPASEWVFPGLKGNHYSRTALENLHTKLRAGASSEVDNPSAPSQRVKHAQMSTRTRFPREFVLHSLRHTYATRLGESGASPFEIKDLLGHSSIKISEKYVHLSGSRNVLAVKRLEIYARLLRGEATHVATSTTDDAHADRRANK